MSKYTTQLRFICESLAGLKESVGVSSVDDVIDKSWNKIFGAYPIFDESYRKDLCCKIIKHYYTREIGEETFGLFKLRLDTKMNEIMPYYNKLYESTLMSFDPLVNKKITRDVGVSTDGTGSTDQQGTSDSINKYSRTPQGGLQGLRDETYLTEARMIGDTVKSNSVSKVKQKEDTNEVISGKDGDTSYSKLIMEYRDSLINVDLLVIKELENCFMGIW